VREREQHWAGLMREANAGDRSAYERLLRELAPVLRGIARRVLARTGQGADAEDAVQETLLAIHLKRHTFETDAPFGPWLNAILRYKLVDAMRRRGRRADVPLDDLAEVLPAAETEPDLRRVETARELDRLPDRQREVVRLMALEGATTAEAAVRLGVSEGAVRVALHRALQALAGRFGS
jgi:RNA polymerase sigma-70 factor (ECF subfamily)